MKWMQLTIWKNQQNSDYPGGKLQDKSFYTVDWFKSPKFRKAFDTDDRIKFVRKKLSELERDDIPDKINVNNFEEIVVTEQGNYGIDQALFHQRMKMPSHLVNNTKNRSKKQRQIKW